MNRSEKIGDLMVALAKAQGEIGMVAKDGFNKYDHYRYYDLPGIIGTMKGAATSQGLAVLHEPNEDNTRLSTTLAHGASEQWITVTYPMVVQPRKAGIPLGPRDYATAMTYAKKATLCSLFLTAADDDKIDDPDTLPSDPDAHDGRRPPPNRGGNGRPAAQASKQGAPKGVAAARQAMAQQQGPAANDAKPPPDEARGPRPGDGDEAAMCLEIRQRFAATVDGKTLDEAAQWVSACGLEDGSLLKTLAKAEYRKAAERLDMQRRATVMAGA